MIEQAVFTSAQTDRSAGYQVVAKSRGVCDADVRDLAVWCPSHDSLLEAGAEACSVNFHPLSSGAYCVSRTIAAGWEYSGRGGHRVYTHCLIVSPQTLSQFANNPFSLLRAAMARGAIAAGGQTPSPLEAFSLPGSASVVDHGLLSRLAANPGPLRMAQLVQAALESRCLAVCGPPSAEKLIAGLINCLPPECRPQFHFCTGLKYSSRRPFRLLGASGDAAEMRWLAHQPNVDVLDLYRPPPCSEAALDSWARLIYRVLAARHITLLASQLSRARPDLSLADLAALALQLLEDLEAASLRSAFQPGELNAICTHPEPVKTELTHGACQRPAEHPDSLAEQTASIAASSIVASDAAPVALRPSESGDPPQVEARPAKATAAHGAHQRFAKSQQAQKCVVPGGQGAGTSPGAAQVVDQSAEVLEKLEHLDDIVFEAIAGDLQALGALRILWPQMLAELGEELLAESREQYLRWALANLESCLNPEADYTPDRALQVLEVMCLLFENV